MNAVVDDGGMVLGSSVCGGMGVVFVVVVACVVGFVVVVVVVGSGGGTAEGNGNGSDSQRVTEGKLVAMSTNDARFVCSGVPEFRSWCIYVDFVTPPNL